HEWAREEGRDLRIGITELGQSELGDVVFVELPEGGVTIASDDPFGSVDSEKTLSESYAPVSGQVVEVNEELAESPEFVNDAPYDKAWMVIVEPANDEELDDLLSAEDYVAHISE